MASITEKPEFDSWSRALAAGVLTPEQHAVLQQLVDEGQVANLAAAAVYLDWQATVIDPPEHLYGF